MNYPPITIDTHRVAIITKFYGPTNYRGSRVTARRGDHQTGDKRYTHQWDHGLSLQDNHAAAVTGLVNLYDWRGQWILGSTGTGYVAVQAPDPLAGADEFRKGDHSIVATYARPVDRDEAYNAIMAARS